MNCPLCLGSGVRRFAEVRASRFFRCGRCRLTFLAPEQRPDPEAERAHYGTHENDPADPRYRAFLDRLATPLARRLPAGAEGLDYGSGPGPALSFMLVERGFRMAVYDPFFAPAEDALGRKYDFVTCAETAEHFFAPAQEWARLDRMLRPGGWLGVMTGMLRDDAAFTGWRYARDPTHVCFYRPETMRWIAGRFGWERFAPARDVTLFRKPVVAG
ncbi:MAG TPA: class I SAM-dependent methyltransferase [Longimicrobiaceae bacterium]|nr:class I SAM-dependent methyltransferase [Longimicrobiaceae bacterium]